MLLRFVYLAFCAILRLGLCRSDGARREAELIVLRHELTVLRRTAGRPRLDWADRALFAALIGALRPDRRAGRIVAPATLVRWHGDLARRRWHYPHRRPGRPPIQAQTLGLILQLARENGRWGYQRITGELAKLAISVSAASVRRVLLRAGVPPAPRRDGPTWREFLHAQADGILACDFFCVDTICYAACTSCSSSRSVRGASTSQVLRAIRPGRGSPSRRGTSYVEHYNHERPHRGRGPQPPDPPPRVIAGPIERHDRLGGLIHHYERGAA